MTYTFIHLYASGRWWKDVFSNDRDSLRYEFTNWNFSDEWISDENPNGSPEDDEESLEMAKLVENHFFDLGFVRGEDGSFVKATTL